jgi:hypothetical protein
MAASATATATGATRFHRRVSSDRHLLATVAVGAASTIALNRLARRPALAASAAAGLAAAGVYATLEPDLVIVLAIGAIVLAVVASA